GRAAVAAVQRAARKARRLRHGVAAARGGSGQAIVAAARIPPRGSRPRDRPLPAKALTLGRNAPFVPSRPGALRRVARSARDEARRRWHPRVDRVCGRARAGASEARARLDRTASLSRALVPALHARRDTRSRRLARPAPAATAAGSPETPRDRSDARGARRRRRAPAPQPGAHRARLLGGTA